MAGRPPKEGIDFAGWDVNIFDSDPKIDALMDAQGCVGFTIYFYLCQRAYGSNGYFYPWCSSDQVTCATVARKVGGGAGANSVEETVNLCLRVGLFDKELCDRERILTSRGIQKRYMQVALTRTNKSVISEYWLLSDEESRGLVKVALSQSEKRIMTPHNSIMTPHNSHIKESKVKESKVKDISPSLRSGDTRVKRFTPPTLEEVEAYCRERGNNVEPQEFIDFYTSKNWMVGKNKMVDWKAACRNAERWERWGSKARGQSPAPKAQAHPKTNELERMKRILEHVKGE